MFLAIRLTVFLCCMSYFTSRNCFLLTVNPSPNNIVLRNRFHDFTQNLAYLPPPCFQSFKLHYLTVCITNRFPNQTLVRRNNQSINPTTTQKPHIFSHSFFSFQNAAIASPLLNLFFIYSFINKESSIFFSLVFFNFFLNGKLLCLK